MRNKAKLIIFYFALILVMSACSTDPSVIQRQALQASLCTFNRTIPNTVVTSIDNSGGIIYGNAINRVDLNYSVVHSALAATRKPKYTKSRLSTCVGYNPYWGNLYPYQCRDEEEIDLEPVFGLGRAPDMVQAELLAIDNCEAAAKDFAERNGIRRSAYALECQVIKKESCY
jgi:hypothetical protein